VSRLEVVAFDPRAVEAVLGAHLGDQPVLRDSQGKPYVEGGPHFNLSHSAGLGLLALCEDVPVGIDLEHVRALGNPAGLLRRMGTPAECEWASAQPDLEPAILRLWVRKEAVAKAEGHGIVTALSGLDVLDHLAHTAGRTWWVHDLPDPAPGFLAAVAWQLAGPGADRP
jgi:4'-phosphopantetheinyl transferase